MVKDSVSTVELVDLIIKLVEAGNPKELLGRLKELNEACDREIKKFWNMLEKKYPDITGEPTDRTTRDFQMSLLGNIETRGAIIETLIRYPENK